MYHENLSTVIPSDRPNLNTLGVTMCIQGTERILLDLTGSKGRVRLKESEKLSRRW